MTASAPATVMHSRANSERSLPTRAVYRTKSDLSIDSVMKAQKLEPPLPPLPRGRQPFVPTDTFGATSLELPVNFSQPRTAPSSPSNHRAHPPIRAKSAITTRRKSPLSTVSNEAETEETGAGNSSQSSTYSRASSQTSSVESAPRRSVSSQASPKLPKLFFGQSKQPATIEISLPYASDDDASVVSHAIPTWRYEDYVQPVSQVETVAFPDPPSHSRKGSLSRSFFQKRPGLVTA
jgi:hypothetical protein